MSIEFITIVKKTANNRKIISSWQYDECIFCIGCLNHIFFK